MTLYGPFVCSRSVLIPNDAESRQLLWNTENKKCVIPLDEALGIDRLPFKMSIDLMLRCAFWAQNQGSYQDAEDVLRLVSGIRVNDDTIRQVTNAIGKLVFEEDCRRAEDLFIKYDQGKLDHNPRKNGVLYIQADGAALNTRHKDENGSTWKENKLGLVFSSNDIKYWTDNKGMRRHRIYKREYVSYVGSVNTFKKHLFECAYRNGYGTLQETVIISDGAAWIANMAEELFPDAQRILDLFHLKENVYEFSKWRFKQDESKYRPWAEEMCQLLEDGHYKEVLSQISESERYPNCVNLYHYINENRDCINYPEYKERGYFVDSGAVVSGNKIVLQERLKRAGMRWEPESAQYLLTLKSKQESGLWQKDVVNYVKSYYLK